MRIALPLLLALTACSSQDAPKAFDPEAKAKQQAARERAADRAAVKAGFVPDAPEPMKTVSVDPPKIQVPGSILPPSDRQYRYIGRWAATTKLCGTGAWDFKTRKLKTAGETSCDFKTVAGVPTGFQLEAICRADGQKTEQTINLTFNEDTRSMSVRGKTIGPAALIYCGD